MGIHRFQRVHLIVLDSVGIGEAPDAHLFGDEGAHTLGHIAEVMDGLEMPNMAHLGLGNIADIQGIAPKRIRAAFTRRCRKLLSGKIR